MKKLILKGLFVLATSAFAQPVAKVTFNNFFVGQNTIVELSANGSVMATYYSGPAAITQTVATISLKNMERLNQRLSELKIEEEARIDITGPVCMDAPSTRVQVLVDGEYKTVYIAEVCKEASEPSYQSGFIINMMRGLLSVAQASN